MEVKDDAPYLFQKYSKKYAYVLERILLKQIYNVIFEIFCLQDDRNGHNLTKSDQKTDETDDSQPIIRWLVGKEISFRHN